VSVVVCEVRSFAERDIDIWLAEELRVNNSFAQWFAEKCNCPADLIYPAERTRIGVMGENNETDVEALFNRNNGSGKWALLIENKVQHSISRDQLDRYGQRGLYGQSAGLWDDHSFVVFAPAPILARHATQLGQTTTISIEEAAEFSLSCANDLRSKYRAEFLARSAMRWPIEAQGSDQYQVKFWSSLFAAVESRYPEFFDLKRKKLSRDTFIAANSLNSPKYLRVDLKGSKGEVDIAFTGEKNSDLIAFLYAEKPVGSSVAYNENSVVLRIKGLPKFLVSDGVEKIGELAMPCFDAAHVLLRFWMANRAVFERYYDKVG
jgi:hypothetical protein